MKSQQKKGGKLRLGTWIGLKIKHLQYFHWKNSGTPWDGTLAVGGPFKGHWDPINTHLFFRCFFGVDS